MWSRTVRLTGCSGSLDRLRAENARLTRLLDLRGQDTTPGHEQLAVPAPMLVTMASPERDKLALYADRFQARTDVHAVRWENARTGASGWISTPGFLTSARGSREPARSEAPHRPGLRRGAVLSAAPTRPDP